MENTDLLKLIEQLKKENESLKKDKLNLENKNIELEDKLAKKDVELYETNKKLNNALLLISSLQEKEKIERTRTFIPKGEKLDNIIINEAEETIKKEKKK